MVRLSVKALVFPGGGYLYIASRAIHLVLKFYIFTWFPTGNGILLKYSHFAILFEFDLATCCLGGESKVIMNTVIRSGDYVIPSSVSPTVY